MSRIRPLLIKLKEYKTPFRLNRERKAHLKQLPPKSFSKKFLSQFKSRKDLKYEQSFVRFAEHKSLHITNLDTERKAFHTTIHFDIIRKIANDKKYDLKNATLIHQHPYFNNTCYPSVSDIRTALIAFLSLGIKKHAISFIDKDNVKEIGRIQYLINKEMEHGFQDIINQNIISGKYTELEIRDKIIDTLMPNKNPRTTEEVMYHFGRVESMFQIKFVGLNGYKFNYDTYEFVKI